MTRRVRIHSELLLFGVLRGDVCAASEHAKYVAYGMQLPCVGVR